MPDDPRVQRLLDELLESGGSPEQVCAGCPNLLPRVRTRWRQIRRLTFDLDSFFPPSGGRREEVPELPAVPGYHVEAVLGRGGMGIVFRARHLRLNRAVALKMILSGAYAVREEVDRFVQEAQAVAALRHPNIVQVYDAGDIDGRPYFTMELVEGGRLSQMVAGTPLPARDAAALVATVAAAIQTAHEKGIVHRDLNPSNILLTADGTPKVTDFGLARRLEGDSGITLTGLPVGTPSYMAPEQARGKKASIGPVVDVYALGAVLYDLLTGRPPFRAETAAATVQQVLAHDPVPPARLNPRVPRDLQTICLKCLTKEPAGRYATAAALADDLGRFLRGEPIRARPVGLAGRLGRWARRKPTAAGLAAALVATALLALALVGAGLRLSGRQEAAGRAAQQDLGEFDERLRHSDLPGARAALERAKGRLGTGGLPDVQRRAQQADSELQRRVGREEQARQLLERLDAVRLVRCALVNGHFDRLRSDREYEEAFRSAGLSPFQESPQFVADRINGSPARAALVAALDDWAVCAAHKLRRDWLLAVARLADPDPWRDRVRDPWVYWDLKNLKELTRTAPAEGQSVQLLVALGERLHTADPKAALPFLRQVQQAYPGDFFANFWIGFAEEPATAVGYFRVAQAVRPDTVVANRNLAGALLALGRTEEAIPYLRRVVAIDPEDFQWRTRLVESHKELARELQKREQWAEAVTEYRAALALAPDRAWTHYDLGMALNSPGHQEEAIEQLRKTLAIDPRYPAARLNLSHILIDRGRADEAITELRQAVALDPRDTGTRADLRGALARLGRWPEVRAAWREELDAGPPEHDTWFGYAELCLFLGDIDGYRRGRTELLNRFGKSNHPTVCERTAKACLVTDGDPRELKAAAALADRAEAARRGGNPGHPYDQFAQGMAAYRLGQFDKAIALMNGDAAKVTPPCPKLITAMSHFRKGERDQAQKILSEALRSFDWNGRPDPGRQEEFWIAHILRREAESLIQPQSRESASTSPAGTARKNAELAGLRDAQALDGLPPTERSECRALWTEVDAGLTAARPAQ